MRSEMADHARPLRSYEPAAYRVTVQGHLGERWALWFDDMQVSTSLLTSGQPISVLSGIVADQAALLGLLQRLYTLGLPLLEVRREEEG